MIGVSLGFVGVLMAFTQGFLTGKIVPRIGEYRAVLLGVSSGVLSMLALAFATQTWGAYAAMLLGTLQGLAYPSMNAIMSKQVPADQQGELQGGVSSMMSLTTIFGPLIMTQTLGRFSDAHAWIYFPGAAFLLASALALLSLTVVLRVAAPSSALPERGAAG
jgi:DHA1 family tetracycline resistance protein-like MFS transporter